MNDNADAESLRAVLRLIEIQKAQQKLLNQDSIFNTPWEIMLVLFVKKINKINSSLSSISKEIGCSQDTVKRYCKFLENANLVSMWEFIEQDISICFVELTEKSFENIKNMV